MVETCMLAGKKGLPGITCLLDRGGKGITIGLVENPGGTGRCRLHSMRHGFSTRLFAMHHSKAWPW